MFIATQGNPDPSAFDAFSTYATFLGPDWFGYETHVIRGLGLSSPDEAAKDEGLMDQARDVAKQVVG